ncbi:hypothetical protein WJX81_001441 [Elliptochloris bilobata]|uniref:BZIP domain-containing protein n=1 Tax=Elliptochloris bilobata TaxID=381761 RepID=A0AAW1QJA4_9CHLO
MYGRPPDLPPQLPTPATGASGNLDVDALLGAVAAETLERQEAHRGDIYAAAQVPERVQHPVWPELQLPPPAPLATHRSAPSWFGDVDSHIGPPVLWGTPWPAPPPVAAAAATVGQGSSDEEEGRARRGRTSAEAASIALREKNRRAQRKFRERQRSRLEDSESKVAALSQQVEQMQLRMAELERSNAALQAANVARAQACATEPRGAIETGGNIVLRPDEIRALPWSEVKQLWCDSMSHVAEALAEARSDAASPAHGRIVRLLDEMRQLYFAYNKGDPKTLDGIDQRMYQSFRNQLAKDQPGDGPPDGHWARVASAWQLSLEQRRLVATCRRHFLVGMGVVRRERSAISAELQRSLTLRGAEVQRTDIAMGGHLAALGVEEALRASLEMEQAIHQALAVSMRQICTPVQLATAFVKAHPWMLDIIALYSVVAEEDGEPPAAELGMYDQPHDNPPNQQLPAVEAPLDIDALLSITAAEIQQSDDVHRGAFYAAAQVRGNVQHPLGCARAARGRASEEDASSALREKNRRAQRKFCERQRNRLQDSESKVAALSQQALAEARSNAASPAQGGVARILEEMRQIYFSYNPGNPQTNDHCDPRIGQRFKGRLDGMNPGGGPPEGHWAHVAHAMSMSPEQRRLATAACRRFLEGVGAVRRERAAITEELQRSLTLHGAEVQRTDIALSGHLAALDAEEALRANLAAEQALHQALRSSMRQICTPFQAGTSLVEARPWMLDLIAVYRVMAEEDGEPPAAELLEGLHAAQAARHAAAGG